MRSIARRAVIVTAAAAVAVAGVASPAYADQQFNATVTGFDGCNFFSDHPEFDETWTFQISGITGGLTAPSQITIGLEGGGTDTVDLSLVTGPLDTVFGTSAFYSYSGPGVPTGEAQATVGDEWNLMEHNFYLLSHPCSESSLTLNVTPNPLPLGQPLTVSGKVQVEGGTLPAGIQVGYDFRLKGQVKGNLFGGVVDVEANGDYSFQITPYVSGLLTVITTHEDVFYSEQAMEIDVVVPDTAPATSATLTSSATADLAGGSTVTVSGSGFKPVSGVTLVLYSTPVELGIVEVDEQGNFSTDVVLPAGVTPGAHKIIAFGIDPQDKSRIAGVDVTIKGVPALASTGVNTLGIAAAAVILLAVGAALLVVARRRRRVPAS